MRNMEKRQVDYEYEYLNINAMVNAYKLIGIKPYKYINTLLQSKDQIKHCINKR